MKEVNLYGPYIGEFAWELLWWQGWVRSHATRSSSKNTYTIACSFNGRQPFYESVDQFIPIEELDILGSEYSSRAYILDSWDQGESLPPVEFTGQIAELITRLKARFKAKVNVFAPWKQIRSGDEIFGTKLLGTDFKHQKPNYSCQSLPILKPSTRASFLSSDDIASICIFPRHRQKRRPDKNLDMVFYKYLAESLLKEGYRVFLLGDPNGAYRFHIEHPMFINLVDTIDSKHRLSLHLAALSKSCWAIGGVSGALFLSLFQGVPTIAVGAREMLVGFGSYENIRNTDLRLIPVMEDRTQIIEQILRTVSF